jgi:hypothetical protein
MSCIFPLLNSSSYMSPQPTINICEPLPPLQFPPLFPAPTTNMINVNVQLPPISSLAASEVADVRSMTDHFIRHWEYLHYQEASLFEQAKLYAIRLPTHPNSESTSYMAEKLRNLDREVRCILESKWKALQDFSKVIPLLVC